MKRQKVVEGALFKIPLSNVEFIYGRVAGGETIVVYDSKTSIEIPHQEILETKILFRIFVSNYVFTKQTLERWEIIAIYPLEKELKGVVEFFVQDMFNYSNIKIYEGDNQFRSATFDECKNLEHFSIWGHDNVVARINDFYLGYNEGIASRAKIKNPLSQSLDF